MPVALAAGPAELEHLIRQGNDMRQKGSDQGALPFFQRAYDLMPSPRTAAQLGLVELALGYSIQAEGHLTEALSSPHHLWVEKHRPQLENSLAEARKAIGRVQITGSPVGAIVLVNANPVGKLPLAGPVKVPEGSVQVLVKAAGFEEKMLKVNVAGGGNEKVMIDLAPANGEETGSSRDPDVYSAPAKPKATRHVAARLAEKSPEPASSAGWVRPAAWVTAALAAGAFGLAGYSFVMAKRNGDSFNGKFKPGTQEHACDSALENQGPAPCATWAHDHDSSQRLGYVGLMTGVLFGAAATVAFLWSADSAAENVAFVPTGDGFAASWSGRF